jgi:hypothetical protein
MAKKNEQHSEASPFVRSVHLALDHRDPNALNGYLLTVGARRVLARLLPALTDPAAARAWTLTGPYGTGKSAFTVFVSQLLAHKHFPGQAEARDILKNVDEDLFESLPAKSKQFRGLFPIAITGSRESLPVALLRGVEVALADVGGRARASLVKRISKLRESAASGETGDRELVDLVEDTGKLLIDQPDGPSGLFLIMDEFGKLLEYAASHPNKSDVYLLQHLQELAARSSVPLLILTVLHKDFIEYADRLSNHERAEWDKVRGRFEDIVFEESADEVLRLVAAARSRGPSASTSLAEQKKFDQLVGQAWKLNLVPVGMSKLEFTSLLTKCWPLHPLVAVLSGPVFRKLAQNERSVFSFLSSQEPHGLLDFLNGEQNTLLYSLDRFYDYLWASLGEGLYSHRNGKKWAEIENAIERVPEASTTDVATLKSVGLLNLVGVTKNIRATPDVLKFALAGIAEPDDVIKSLKNLANTSVVVSREYSGAYALWEGSDVDIDDRVRVARDRLDRSEPLAKMASRYIQLRPVVARKHAYLTGTLRYFTMHFVAPQSLAAEMMNLGNADGRILVALPTNNEEHAVIKKAVKSQAGTALRVIVAVPAEIRILDLCVRELAGLEWVRENTPELAGDLTARRELRARIAELRRQLETLTQDMLSPASDRTAGCEWYYNGKNAADITSKRSLNDFISACCKQVFSKTPRILNELVNRRELSSAAAAGRRTLIEKMITQESVPMLGIEGFPPEKSMYLTLLSDPGIHAERDEGLAFGLPKGSADAGVQAVWETIRLFFDSTEKSRKTVRELFNLLSTEPYGLRDGPMPVLFCAALIANDSDVALYEEGSFVPQLSITVFERLMKLPESYTVRRWRISGVRTQVFRQLAEMLGKNWGTAKISKKNVLDVVRPLLRFVAQLPETTQKTELLSDQAKKVRAVLSQSREADQLLFTDLPRACGVEPFDPDGVMNEKKLDAFLSHLRGSLGEMQRYYDTLINDLGKTLGSAFSIDGPIATVKGKLTERATALQEWVADPAVKNFVTRATEPGDDQVWVESLVALLSERPPSLWRDADRARFDIALVRIVRLFNNLEVLAFSNISNKRGFSKFSEAIRIGITTRESGDVERVVHIDAKDRARMDDIEARLHNVLHPSDLNGKKDVTLAAIARLAKKLLS